MGLDAIYQAIPDDRKLLELAKTDWNWLFALTSPIRHRFKSFLRQSALNRGGEKFIQEFDNYFDRHVEVLGLV